LTPDSVEAAVIHPFQLFDACLGREADQGENGLAGPAVGVRELSMSPFRAARVRYFLREKSVADLQSVATTALQSKGRQSLPRLLTDFCEEPTHANSSSAEQRHRL
jgi:signal transduction protein with GAF and PtsI domain